MRRPSTQGAARRWIAPVLFLVLLSLHPPVAIGVAAAIVTARVGWTVARRLRSRGPAAPAGEPAIGATLLGSDDAGRPVFLADGQLAAHGLVLGASGAGKTTTLLAVLGSAIARGQPVVALDLKGSPSFADGVARAAAAAGRPLRLWTLDGGDVWNPLGHGNPTELKDKLIATERFTEPHYRRAAERYVQTAVAVLQETGGPGSVSLGRVVWALEPTHLASLVRRLPPARAARIEDYLQSLGRDGVSAVRGLASRLAVVSESHTGAFLEPGAASAGGSAGSGGRSPIDLRRALAGEEVVLFSLNSSSYSELAGQVGTLVVQDLVSAAGHRLGAGTTAPALVAIDEFSALGSDNVIGLLARGREAGVRVLLSTQELADLDRAARGLRDQVLGNTALKIAHRQDVPESADAVARMIGTVTVPERSVQSDVGLFGWQGHSRESVRLVERFAVDPNRIRTLETGEAVMIVKTPRAAAGVIRVRPQDGVPRPAKLRRAGRTQRFGRRAEGPER